MKTILLCDNACFYQNQMVRYSPKVEFDTRQYNTTAFPRKPLEIRFPATFKNFLNISISK